MNFKLIILSFLVFTSGFSHSQGKQLKVYLDENQFYTPEVGNYYEVSLSFFGYSLNYVNTDDQQYAEVEVTQIFSQNDSIISADRYLLKSPLVIDSLVEDFYDIQKYPLKPGRYTYELAIKDVNSKEKPVTVRKEIRVGDLSKTLSTSSFIAAESITPNPQEVSVFTRFGYDVVPMTGNYYPEAVENLLYYLELYNTDKFLDDSVYVVEQKIIGRGMSADLSDFTRYYRYNSSPIQPISKLIDIRQLPTGSYTLELNILDRDKTIIARSSFEFDRNNSDEMNDIAYQDVILDPKFEASIPLDSTGYYMASLIPISGRAEVKNIIRILKEKDKDKNFKYLQAFWISTDRKDPYGAWIRYKAQVQLVEQLYSTNFQVGFETDRGRVYLQYGAPSSIYEEMSSPSEYPYEIWQYDRIEHYSNRRFVFYNPTNLNKNYELLHSDMLGELQNRRWQYALNKRNTPDSNLDENTLAPNHFGGNSRRYFDSY